MSIRGHRPRLYGIWLRMRSRCRTTTDKHYPGYGGRGIKVCAAWDSYEAFHAWANANGYQDHLTLDRINNDGNYEPSNCRWATYTEQARNTRRNILITYGGETHPLIVWVERTGLPYAMLRSRHKMGWSDAEIIGKKPRISPPAKRRWSKLTEDDAKAIRESAARGVDLAKQYGVSRSLICQIKRGSAWPKVRHHA